MSLKQFQVLNKLGEGAYSSVYKVQRLKDGTQYALKKVKLSTLSEKEQENALNEVRILASINNPYIIGYKQAFIENNSLCVIMEYADDCDLYQKIVEHKKNNQTFTEEQIWRVLIHVAKGLKTLHNMNIFHRDLKSANVFLTKEGVAKLGDMNVSKIAKNGMLYTQTGTPYYASPEVWMDKPYDSKSDIWSLGCVMYEMITLKPPFRAEDMEGLYKKVVKGMYQKIPTHYSIDLSNIIKAMLQVNASMRPSSDKLLQSSIFVKKSQELNIVHEDFEEMGQSQLLKTIRLPKGNMHYLTDRLPKANYLRQLDMLDRTNLKIQTSPDKHSQNLGTPSNLPKLDLNSKSVNHRRLTKDYHRRMQTKVHRELEVKPKEYIDSIKINKLYNVKSYKSPAVLQKPQDRNISLPPIKG